MLKMMTLMLAFGFPCYFLTASIFPREPLHRGEGKAYVSGVGDGRDNQGVIKAYQAHHERLLLGYHNLANVSRHLLNVVNGF